MSQQLQASHPGLGKQSAGKGPKGKRQRRKARDKIILEAKQRERADRRAAREDDSSSGVLSIGATSQPVRHGR